MKKLLQKTLAVALFAGISLSASAQMEGEKSNALAEKIATEALTELMANTPAGKEPTEKDIVEVLLKKMRAHVAEFKEAGVEDCLKTHGSDKKDACQCVVDKTDLEAMFSLMEKQLADPKADLTEEGKKMQAQTEENYKACGLDINVEKEAAAKKEAAKKEKK